MCVAVSTIAVYISVDIVVFSIVFHEIGTFHWTDIFISALKNSIAHRITLKCSGGIVNRFVIVMYLLLLLLCVSLAIIFSILLHEGNIISVVQRIIVNLIIVKDTKEI
jgi:hypothetical protein